MTTIELYRSSSIGNSLTETLDWMVSTGKLDPLLAIQVLVQFDKSMANAMKKLAKGKLDIKGHLHTYRFCDDVWTFILTGATFKSSEISQTLRSVKIVACDSKLQQPEEEV